MTDNTKYEVTDVVIDIINVVTELQEVDALDKAYPEVLERIEAYSHRLTSQPAQSDLVERAKWVAIRQREAGDITAAKIIEDLLSNFDTPTTAQPDRERVLREAAEEVRINILWAERHYSGAEFGTIAWPEVKAAVDNLLALLTHPTTDTQSDAVRDVEITGARWFRNEAADTGGEK